MLTPILCRKAGTISCIVVAIFLCSLSPLRAQFSAMRFTHTKEAKAKLAAAEKNIEMLSEPGEPGDFTSVTAKPILKDFSPKSAGFGKIVKITGSNFTPATNVTLGGAQVGQLSIISNNEIEILVAEGNSGEVVVANKYGSDSLHDFVFAEVPTITNVSRDPSAKPGTMILIIQGTNLTPNASVEINDGTAPYQLVYSSSKKVTAYFGLNSAVRNLTLSTGGGDAIYPTSSASTTGVDLNLPNPGDGLTIIPTPSFDYNQLVGDTWLGFAARVWGNVLPTDSSRQKLGAKFLTPEISQFGVKLELNARLSKLKRHLPFTASLECNILWKKVSFFDTASKQHTNFNPLVIHTRLGLVWSLVNDTYFIAAYGNVPTVMSCNKEFADFFHVPSRNMFIYPEVDCGGLIPLSKGANQAFKFQFNFIFNNGDVQKIMGTSNGAVVPYLKFGFVSTL